MPDIKALIFDFGGVFTDSPFTAVEKFSADIGTTPEKSTEIFFGSYENDGDHPWHQLERGEISLENCREQILALGARHDLEADIYVLFGKMAETGAGAAGREPLMDRVKALKHAGYPLGIITNNVKEFGDTWRGLFTFAIDEVFDFVVDSSAVGVRKPDAKIFQIALDKLPQLHANEILFLDDYQANLNAAATLGLQTQLVQAELQDTLAVLDRLLND